jgi:hypothetical protein
VDPVESDAQIVDAAGLTLALFQLDQEAAAVVAELAQFVQQRVVPAADHAAFLEQGRDRVGDRCEQSAADLVEAVQLGGQRGEQRIVRRHRSGDGRQRQQAVAQPGEIARPGAAQGDAGGDAFDVHHRPQRLA